MKIPEVVAFVRAMRGYMSETVRSSVAYGVAKMIGRSIKPGDDGPGAISWWKSKGRMQFLHDCGVTQDPCTTPDDITAPPTALAEFINRWRATVAYKTPEGDFEELTNDMKALIVTMTEELEDVAEVPDD